MVEPSDSEESQEATTNGNLGAFNEERHVLEWIAKEFESLSVGFNSSFNMWDWISRATAAAAAAIEHLWFIQILER